MRELHNLILAGGFAPSEADLYQVIRSIRGGKLNFFADVGTADAMVIEPDPAFTAYAAGIPLRVIKADFPNLTSTPTINVNGLGPKVITAANGGPVLPGSFEAKMMMELVYDGVVFRERTTKAASLRSFFSVGDSGGSTAVSNNTTTKLTHVTNVLDTAFLDTDTNWGVDVASALTIGARDAGIWLLTGFAAFTNGSPPTNHDIRLYFGINGGTTSYNTNNMDEASTYSIMLTHTLRLDEGDVVDLRLSQNSGGSRNVQSAELTGIRLDGPA